MKLQDLPLEMLGEIMGAIHDPDDLRSFTAASPDGLRTFNLFRDRILVSVSLNAIEPEARSAALAIGHVPYMETNEDGKLQREFLNDFFGSGDERLMRPPQTSEQISSFCGLVCRIMYFVNHFSDQAWTILHTNYPVAASRSLTFTPSVSSTLCSPPPLVLSREERASFQRAFFLLELFAKAFPVYRFGFAKEIIGDQAQADHFLSRLEPWDVEAMSCVFYYYTRLILKHTTYVENDFVDWVMAMPSLYRLPVPDRISSSNIIQHPETTRRLPAELQAKLKDWNWYFFYKMDYERHSLTVFSRRRRESDQQLTDTVMMPNLRSLFAYRLVHSTGDERARLVIGGDLYADGCSFFDVAAALTRRHHAVSAQQGHSSSGDIRNTAKMVFFNSTGRTGLDSAKKLDRAMNSAVRERAHIFWGSQRIQQQMGLDAKLDDAASISYEDGIRLTKTEFRPSVQERLDAVGVHHVDFHPLLRRIYGDLFYNDMYSPGYEDDETDDILHDEDR